MIRVISIRTKLVAAMVASAVVALALAGAAMIRYDQATYTSIRTADVATQAQLLGAASAAALAFDDSDTAEQNLSVLRFRPRMIEAVLYDTAGLPFAGYVRDGDTPGAPVSPGPLGIAIVGDELTATSRIVHNDEYLGTIVLRAEYGARERMRNFLAIAGLAWLAALALAFALALWLQRVITRPILLINEAARDVREHRGLAHRAPKVTSDEVGELADSFNLMLDELQARTAALEDSNARLRDEIAARREAEAEVRALNETLEQRIAERTAELERSNRELEAFSYTVSHDLRSPLRAITGFAHALKSRLPPDLDPESESHFERIRAAVRRMGQRIDALLNLAHLSRLEMAETAVDLGGLAGDALAELQQREPARIVDVRIARGAIVRGDPKLLRSLMDNLIGNAWKFTSGKRDARIEFGMMRDDGETVYFVRDNGVGFDMQHAEKLFEPFQRVHSAADYPGTGIGLATVKRIVERHGGRIWVEAEERAGATFFFTIGEADE